MRGQRKIDMIFQYFTANPNRAITATEIAKHLNIKANVVVTTLNRLAKANLLQKVRRGLYVYNLPADVSSTELERIYGIVYDALKGTMGGSFFSTKKFDAERGWQTTKALINDASAKLGEKFVGAVVKAHLTNVYKPEKVNYILRMLDIAP